MKKKAFAILTSASVSLPQLPWWVVAEAVALPAVAVAAEQKSQPWI